MALRLRTVPVVVVLFVLGLLCASPAFALTRAQTRDVQEKLILLGYEPGPIDGLFGRKTRAAVRSFQRDAHLKVDGIVGRNTRSALDEFAMRGGPDGAKPVAANIQLDIYEDALTDRLASGSVTLPSRYANVEVSRAGAGRYTVSINGKQVAASPGGNGLLRISRTFELPGEDTYVFASASGNRSCHLEHTLLVVRADGSFLPPAPIGNCKEVLNGRVLGDSLVLSFPPVHAPSWRLEESWIYEYGKISRK